MPVILSNNVKTFGQGPDRSVIHVNSCVNHRVIMFPKHDPTCPYLSSYRIQMAHNRQEISLLWTERVIVEQHKLREKKWRFLSCGFQSETNFLVHLVQARNSWVWKHSLWGRIFNHTKSIKFPWAINLFQNDIFVVLRSVTMPVWPSVCICSMALLLHLIDCIFSWHIIRTI